MNLKYRDNRGMLVKLISPKLDDGTASKLDDLYRGIFSNKDLLDMDKGLVHNDFSCSNILFDTEKKRISGVLISAIPAYLILIMIFIVCWKSAKRSWDGSMD